MRREPLLKVTLSRESRAIASANLLHERGGIRGYQRDSNVDANLGMANKNTRWDRNRGKPRDPVPDSRLVLLFSKESNHAHFRTAGKWLSAG